MERDPMVERSGTSPPAAPERDFTIDMPERPGAPWHGGDGEIGMTVIPPANGRTGKTLADGRAVHLYKANYIRRACTPRARREQWLVGELDGVFVHVGRRDGRVHVVMADHRLDP